MGKLQLCNMSGPVAQLGARFHGMEEVIGSIPIRSTNNKIKDLKTNQTLEKTAPKAKIYARFMQVAG